MSRSGTSTPTTTRDLAVGVHLQLLRGTAATLKIGTDSQVLYNESLGGYPLSQLFDVYDNSQVFDRHYTRPLQSHVSSGGLPTDFFRRRPRSRAWFDRFVLATRNRLVLDAVRATLTLYDRQYGTDLVDWLKSVERHNPHVPGPSPDYLRLSGLVLDRTRLGQLVREARYREALDLISERPEELLEATETQVSEMASDLIDHDPIARAVVEELLRSDSLTNVGLLGGEVLEHLVTYLAEHLESTYRGRGSSKGEIEDYAKVRGPLLVQDYVNSEVKREYQRSMDLVVSRFLSNYAETDDEFARARYHDEWQKSSGLVEVARIDEIRPLLAEIASGGETGRLLSQGMYQEAEESADDNYYTHHLAIGEVLKDYYSFTTYAVLWLVSRLVDWDRKDTAILTVDVFRLPGIGASFREFEGWVRELVETALADGTLVETEDSLWDLSQKLWNWDQYTEMATEIVREVEGRLLLLVIQNLYDYYKTTGLEMFVIVETLESARDEGDETYISSLGALREVVRSGQLAAEMDLGTYTRALQLATNVESLGVKYLEDVWATIAVTYGKVTLARDSR